MLAQRIAARGPSASRDLKSIADVAIKAVSDAHADARQSARLLCVVLTQAVGDGALEECSVTAKLQGSLAPGVDPGSYDAFEAGAGLRSSPSSAQGGTRMMSRGGLGS